MQRAGGSRRDDSCFAAKGEKDVSEGVEAMASKRLRLQFYRTRLGSYTEAGV